MIYILPLVSEYALSLWPYSLSQVGRTTPGCRRDEPQQVLPDVHMCPQPCMSPAGSVHTGRQTGACSAGLQVIAASASWPRSTILPVHRVVVMLSEGVKAYHCKLKASQNLQAAYLFLDPLVILTKQIQREIVPLLTRCPASRWIINTLGLFHHKKSSWRVPNLNFKISEYNFPLSW